MAEKNTEKNGEKNASKTPLPRKKRIMIIGISIIAGLLICAGIILAVVLSGNTGYTLDGTYKMTLEAGVELSSQYIFDNDTVRNEYYDGTDMKSVEYTYTIKKNGDGRIIILKEADSGEEHVYSFAEKTENGVKSIMINSVWYDKQ